VPHPERAESRKRARSMLRAARKDSSLASFAWLTGGRKTAMIVGAPIKVLSNEVALQTATAVKEFYELCMAAEPNASYIALPAETQERIVELNRIIGRLGESQYKLLNALENVSDEQVTKPEFAKVISDLGIVVAQVESAVDETYNAPTYVATLVRKNLECVADQNSHVESYVESFRIAFDENCSALLADLATKVVEG